MLKERFNFLSFGQKMKDSKYIFDSWFNDLYEDLAWEQACKEQENHDKAAYLAISFFPPGGRLPIREKMAFSQTK